MTNERPKNETFTWLQPSAWRKPCIVHVTMVANLRQALFGKLAHNSRFATSGVCTCCLRSLHVQPRGGCMCNLEGLI